MLRERTSPLDLTGLSEQQMKVFSDSTRILKQRRYAKKGPYEPANLLKPPTIFDMSPPTTLTTADPERFWLRIPYRTSILVGAYFAFPTLLDLLNPLVDPTSLTQIQQVIDSFVPGISILFGTLCSLTASILYQRQMRLQQACSEESALLAQTIDELLHLFYRDEHVHLALSSAQSTADYIATLVSDSRGQEIMLVAVDDPISRFNKAVHEYNCWCDDKDCRPGVGTGSALSLFTELSTLRARRLSDEALILPPTHFFILATLSFLILGSYVLVCLATYSNGAVSLESRVLFSLLTGVYVLFFNFTNDLNRPFAGVYQIRRSSTASNLLKSKRLILERFDPTQIHFGFDDDGNRV